MVYSVKQARQDACMNEYSKCSFLHFRYKMQLYILGARTIIACDMLYRCWWMLLLFWAKILYNVHLLSKILVFFFNISATSSRTRTNYIHIEESFCEKYSCWAGPEVSKIWWHQNIYITVTTSILHWTLSKPDESALYAMFVISDTLATYLALIRCNN
jgi:hypothetical protein